MASVRIKGQMPEPTTVKNTTTSKPRLTIGIIGSFRQHYDQVLYTWNIFTQYGIPVITPKGTTIIEKDIPFVRFVSDNPTYDDFAVQSLTLHRLMSTYVVYVVAPGGYVGRTTSYEIGRLLQAQKPLYFSNQPADLPIQVSTDNILTPEELAKKMLQSEWKPSLAFNETNNLHHELELNLVNGNYRLD